MHVITNASTMVGDEISRILARIGLEAMCDTGVVPSGIPNAILFNNVAFVKAAPVINAIHPAMNPVQGLDYDIVGSIGSSSSKSNMMSSSMNMHSGMQNSGSFGTGPSNGTKNGGFPNPLSSSNGGGNGYGAARGNNNMGAGSQNFQAAVKGTFFISHIFQSIVVVTMNGPVCCNYELCAGTFLRTTFLCVKLLL